MKRLSGRSAVIIGVGSDIGRAVAHLFAEEGAAIMAVDPDETTAVGVARAISSKGATALAHRADYDSESEALALADRCLAEFGELQIVFNCTAVLDFWTNGEDSVENWEVVWRANFIGPLIYAKALMPMLHQSKVGSLVFLSALDGLYGNPNYPLYSASKGALIPLTHVLAYDAALHGTRVNCIATGGIDPSGTGPTPRDNIEHAKWLPLTPLGRRGEPEEVAKLALFLASDDSSYLTGTVIPFDGGRTGITPGTIFRPPLV